jgi:hypothetical protein
MIPNFKRIPTKITNIRIKSLSCNQNNPMGQKCPQNGPMRNKMGGKRGNLRGGGGVGVRFESKTNSTRIYEKCTMKLPLLKLG